MALTKAQKLKETLSGSKTKERKLLMFPEILMSEGNANVIRFSINLPSGSKYIGTKYKKAKDQNGNDVTSVYRTKSRGSLAGKFSGNYTRIASTIDLFMPPEIKTSYGSDWGQENVGVLGSAVEAGQGLTSINNWDDAAKAWEVVKRTIKESGIRTMAAAVQAITPFNFESLHKTAASTISNPYVEVLFNGVSNRTFSFTFKMIAKNEREQESIKAIVDEFKFHRAPEYKYGGQNNYMLFPSEFDIQFLNQQGENPWLFKISTCALTNMSVDYSPEGSYSSHEGGAPFSCSITLDFTELQILTKEDHEEGY